MRIITLIIGAASLMLLINACHKSNVETNVLAGKWQLVSDSTSYPYVDTLTNTSFFVGSTYIGTADDYYDFTTTGELQIQENSQLSTIQYSAYSDTVEFIYPPGLAWFYSISNFTSHTLTLTAIGGWGPARREIINLKR